MEKGVAAMTALGLLLNFIGTILVFLDSWRTSKCFTNEGISLGWPLKLRTYFWRTCGRFGIATVGTGFLITLIAEVSSK